VLCGFDDGMSYSYCMDVCNVCESDLRVFLKTCLREDRLGRWHHAVVMIYSRAAGTEMKDGKES